jgi:ABC-type proline/glycine betaine transport system permease subunit
MTKFGAFFFVSAFSYLMLSGLGSARVSFAVLSVLIGILASLFVRVSVVTISSFVGGMLLGASVFGIIKGTPFPYIYIPVGLSLFVLGMAIQFSFAKTKKRKRRREEARSEEGENE